MTLAAILGMCLLALGGVHAQAISSLAGFLPQAAQPAQETAPAQSTPPAQTSGSPPANSSTPGSKHHIWHHKKVLPPGCSDISLAPAANSQNQPAPGATSAPAVAAGSGASAAKTATKPCPPPKKIVRNGGASEPSIELTADSSAQQAAQKRSTDQLTAATEDNLKKIEGRELNTSQKQTADQVRQFLKQSKDASSAGNADLAHNLAQKAQLLSEELVKP